MTRGHALGLDFGTESVRAVVLDLESGALTATAVAPFAHGVIDRSLPEGGPSLPHDWALQDSNDWLTSMELATREALATAGVEATSVKGIGIDFTASTILPTTADGTPLHALDALQAQPHAWPKLWKHHAAQAQADRINAVAGRRGEKWLPRYGGKVSSEWLLAKALEMLDDAPDIYAAADRIVEAGDWVAWRLTGSLARNACAAGYKALWHKRDGYPSTEFLKDLDPGLENLYTSKIHGRILPPGHEVGGLEWGWAERLSLAEGTPVASPIIDAHAALPGGGVSGPGTLFIVLGTSSCHLLLAGREVLVEGMSGVVEDGILPGLFAYDSGQAGVGDIFGWYVRSGSRPGVHEPPFATPSQALSAHADSPNGAGAIHDLLSARAAAIAPGESGLLAVDWWNGCRTPLVDADLSGMILGYTLETTPEAIYRALIEATAFGTRLIIDTFTAAGLSVDRVRVSGGLSRNDLLTGIYADVTGLPLEVCATQHASGVGAAMLGAVAGGVFDGVDEAARSLAQAPARTVTPRDSHRATYDALYAQYLRLVELFGRDPSSPLKQLRALRQR
jgi:L-ribulokinase